jgi:hypothetical protein
LISLHPLIVDWADDAAETVGVTRHWNNNYDRVKRSKQDKKKRMKARIEKYGESDYGD